MPRRSRASTTRPLSCSTIASANMPRKCCTKSSPHSRQAFRTTSVSEVEAKRWPAGRSSWRGASCAQLVAEGLLVVDAAVEDHRRPGLLVDHRLGAAGGEVDDGEPPVSERRTAVLPEALA